MTTTVHGADDPVLRCYRYLLNRRAERMAQQNKTGDAGEFGDQTATPAGDGPRGEHVIPIVDAETHGASCCKGSDV
jgi:hypothetical protein